MSKYLSFDVGSKTVGIAKSEGVIVSPGPTIRFEENNFDEASTLLAPILKQEDPKFVVVGWPRNMDGTSGHRVQMVEEFVHVLLEYFPDLKILKEDERLTTRMARGLMNQAGINSKKQKSKKDTVAAVLILESFLAHRN